MTAAGVKVSYTDQNGKPQAKEAEKVLVAVGRAGRTEDIGLKKTKIELDRGLIKVDEAQQTAEPGVYAIGDIVLGLPQLAHAGSMSGMVAVANIAGRPFRPLRRNRIPGCTYCEPQIGSVGLTEAQLREKGLEIKVGKFPSQATPRLRSGLARRLRKDRRRPKVWRDTWRPYPGSASHRADCRSCCGNGAGRNGRRDDVHHPCASDAKRIHARRIRRGRRHGHQRVEKSDGRVNLRPPIPLLRAGARIDHMAPR